MSMTFNHPTRIDGNELFSFYFLMAVSVLALAIRKERVLDTKVLGAIVMLALITTIIGFRVPQRQNLINVFVGAMAFKVISERVLLTTKALGAVLFVYAAATSIMLLIQAQAGLELCGFVEKPWVMGCIGVMAVPFVRELGYKYLIALAPMIYFSSSTVCIAIALGILAIPFLLKYHRFAIPLILISGAAVAAYVFFYDKGIDLVRIRTFINTAKNINNFITGEGIGTFAHSGFAILNGTGWEHWRWAHNELYQHFFEQGIIGLGIVSSYLVAFFKSSVEAVVHGVLAVFSLSMFHPIFHFGTTIVLVLVVLAMAEASTKRGNYGI